jgi:competence protein ComEC
MIRFTLAFTVGVLLFQYQPRLPHPALFAAYLTLLLCAVPLRWCRMPAWLVLGFAWAHGHGMFTRPPDLPLLDLQQPLWIEGEIASMVATTPQRSRFVFHAKRMAQGDWYYEGDWRLRLSWYRDSPRLLPGEHWRLRVRLRPVSSYANPGGFDFAHWSYQQGIRYQGTVKPDTGNQLRHAAAGLDFTRLRQRLSEAMQAALEEDGQGNAALLRALVVGDRAGFSQHDWQVFRATGTNHLVAISGLHIGLVAGLVLAIVRALWRRRPWLYSRWPAVQAGAVVGWLAALAYAGLAGFAIPTQRALLMLSVGLAALLSGRLHRAADAMCVALLAVLCWAPMAVSSPGLWLSFSAVGVILWSVSGQPHAVPLWQRWGRAQLAVWIGLLPLLLLWFQQATLLAPLVNLVAIPVFSLLLVPLALVASCLWLLWPAPGEVAWRLWSRLSEPVRTLLAELASWPGVELQLPAPNLLTLGLALFGVLLLLSPRGLPLRGMGGILLLPLLLNRPAAPVTGAFSLHLLDVGQGLAAVIRTRNHVLVYDAGPAYRSGFNTGDAVVAPYLQRLGIRRIDRLVVSHADMDHAGGAAALLRRMAVSGVLAGEPEELPGSRPCRAGQRWHWDGVAFRVLSPSADVPRGGNNASCVIQVSGPGGSLLLTGDIEASTERRLLESGALAHTTAVLVPHHGSRTSSTAGFVAQLAPSYVLYPTGRGNRWGFPKADVMARWRLAGATAWDTATDGAVEMIFGADGELPEVRGHRRAHYWNP